MSEESGWKGLGYTIGITEVPLMIFIGYVLGRKVGRETEGIIIGGLLGTILLAAYAFWALRKSREISSSADGPAEPTTTRPRTP